MADDEILSQFCAIMNSNEEEAKFFLDATNYNLNDAMNAYLQSRATEDDESGFMTGINEHVAATMNSNSSTVVPDAEGNAPPDKKETRFATLNSIRPTKPTRAHDDDDSSSEEEGQAFFVGGGGQQVLGPPKRRVHQGGASSSSKGNLIHSVFKSAQDHGAEVVDTSESPQGAGRSFHGMGYRLGDSTEGSGGSQPTTHSAGPESRTISDFKVIVKMWKNGFTWNDSDLIAYDGPVGVKFLNSLATGKIPADVLAAAKGVEVDLQMEDHRGEEWKVPPLKPFSGQGQVLGESSSTSAAGTSSGTMMATTSGQNVAHLGVLEVDSLNASQPTTQIQIRLSDGAKLVLKLNHTHTVGDIRALINRHHDVSRARAYDLMLSYPKRDLTDDSRTISEAGITNAVLMQRMK